MIVRMKKVSIVIKSSWVDKALDTLGELGVLHIRPVATIGSDTIAELKKKIQIMDEVVSNKPEHICVSESNKFSNEDGFTIAKQLLCSIDEVKRIDEEIKLLITDSKRLEVWGRFDPKEITRLKEAGITVKFYKCQKSELNKIPENCHVNIISEDGDSLYLAVVSNGNNLEAPLEEIKLPICGIDEIESIIKKKEDQLLLAQNRIANLYEAVPAIKKTLIQYKELLNYEEAKAGIGKEENISYLVGFCPETLVGSLENAAGKNGWAIHTEDPSDEDTVPTFLKNSRWTRLFQPVMKFIGVTPGYNEADTNGIFLIFFSLFFAMIIGDGGYGITLLIAAFLIQRYYKKISKEQILLIYILSITTIAWGAVTGMWFGFEKLSQIPPLKMLIIPALNTYSVESEASTMRLCFFIAVIHLSLARIWAAMRAYPSFTAFAETGWAALIWGMYLIAKSLLLHDRLSIIATILIGYWFVSLILFGEQKNDGFLRGVIRGMARFLMNLLSGIGSFSDIISYIRLFAVGLASKEIALAFNNIAMDIGFQSILLPMAILILIFGHTLNMILGAMSVLVHGIRLNLLEFSNHLNIQWSGISYCPFKTQYKNITQRSSNQTMRFIQK